MAKKYLDINGTGHLIDKLNEKFALKGESSDGVFVPDVEIRTRSLGGNYSFDFRFKNADLATLNSIAGSTLVGLARLKKTARNRTDSFGVITKRYSGKKWCMIDDETSNYSYQCAIGDVFNPANITTNVVFWTDIQIKPQWIDEGLNLDGWSKLPYTKEQLAERFIYFRGQQGNTVGVYLISAETFVNPGLFYSNTSVKVLGELHNGKKQITQSRNGNKIFKCSIPLGLVAARKIDNKVYYGNVAQFMLDFIVAVKVISGSKPLTVYIKETGIRLMSNTDKMI
jgi:hypothetical protein